VRDIFLFAAALAFAILGFQAGFAFGLGYIWTDYFNPQLLAFSFLRALPLSLIMGTLAIITYVISQKQHTRFTANIWLLGLWAIWITLTTTWAEVPSDAWQKWDWAFKTVCFAAFLPFLFGTRVRLEALLLTAALSVSGSILAFAAKTALGGSRYGASFSLIGANHGLGEEATLGCLAVALVPIFIHFHLHGLIFKNRRLSFGLFYGLASASLIAAVGTFERTSLIAVAVLAVCLWWNSKRKVLFAVLCILAISVSSYFLSNEWLARMDTIQHPQGDVSAMGRLAVWKWDIDYAASNPWGGGFSVYKINQISIIVTDKNATEPTKIVNESARAPHSMYFEVLSEQGIPGFLIFAAIILVFFRNVWWIHRQTKDDESLAWAGSLSKALAISGAVYLSGGAFQGIAFQPYFYHLVAAAIILMQCALPSARGKSTRAELASSLGPHYADTPEPV
jgi:probable O-glycosylation ligase (exosortase A-associated)